MRPEVSDDLGNIAQLLENLGDSLASDPALIARHGIALQNLDIAMQTLNALASSMRTECAADAASLNRLDELRISCAQALQA